MSVTGMATWVQRASVSWGMRVPSSWVCVGSERGPLGPVGEPGAGDDALARGLGAAQQVVLVDRGAAVVLDHAPSADEDRVHPATVRGPDELVGDVVQRPPLRAVGVVQDEVGLLAHLDRA